MRLRSLTITATLACAIALGQSTAAHADPTPTTAVAANNSGLLAGNIIQIPIHVPVNLCGTGISVLALLNPVSGNECQNN